MLSGYATEEQLFATRYKQGGRTVYSVALTPDQIVNLIPRPDPDGDNPGNRRIRPNHALGFAKYFMEHEDWVIPGTILRAPGVFTFEAEQSVGGADFGVLSYPKRLQSDIQILDGQHRILGFHLAEKAINDNLHAARTQRDRAKRVEGDTGAAYREALAAIETAERQRDRFLNERVMVEIHITDDQQQYRQMFFDIADNALGITASVKARFDTRKVVNRALPAVLEHPLLRERTDLEVDRLSKNSPYLLSARHVMETMRVLTVGLEGRVSRRQDSALKEADIANNAAEFLDGLLEAFPPYQALIRGQTLPEQLRQTSLLGSPLFIRILAGVYYELIKEHAWKRENVLKYFATLAPHLVVPIHENSIFTTQAPDEAFTTGGIGPNGRRQDIRGLTTALVDWAVMDEPFLYAEPLPAPAAEGDEAIDYRDLTSDLARKLAAEGSNSDLSET